MERQKQSQSDDLFDNLEEEFQISHESSGYETGLQLGKKDGQEQGFSQGFREGAKIGSEVGFYRGYTMTYIQLLQVDPVNISKLTKTLNKLNEVLMLTDSFPKTNETSCEEQLLNIRAKFRQSTSNLKTIKTSQC